MRLTRAAVSHCLRGRWELDFVCTHWVGWVQEKTFTEDHKGEKQEQREGRAIGHIPQECRWEPEQRHKGRSVRQGRGNKNRLILKMPQWNLIQCDKFKNLVAERMFFLFMLYNLYIIYLYFNTFSIAYIFIMVFKLKDTHPVLWWTSYQSFVFS